MPFAPETIAAYRELSTPLISDVMGRMAGIAGLKQYHRNGRMVGPALTVKTRAGDNLMIHHAMDIAKPGDILVVDGGGSLERALFGELMQRYAESKGIAGVVIYGAIRDIARFQTRDFPCFACGHFHRGPMRDGVGAVNVSIAIGGEVVNPGDLMVGDENGVVTVPAAGAERILDLAQKLEAKEEGDKAAIEAGAWDRSWVEPALRSKGIL